MREEAELQEWQIEKIQRGIREADAGEFATDEEVAAVFARFIEEEGGGSLSRPPSRNLAP